MWKQGIVGIGKKTQPFQVLFQGKRGLPSKCLELNTGKWNIRAAVLVCLLLIVSVALAKSCKWVTRTLSRS